MQYARHNSARKIFREIDRNPQNYLIIHYSCESFYDIKDGHTGEEQIPCWDGRMCHQNREKYLWNAHSYFCTRWLKYSLA